MGIHETQGKSDEWYTPKYIFDSLGVVFDLDVAHPTRGTHVPAKYVMTEDSLDRDWDGFIWMNPPWCDKKDKLKWIQKFIRHNSGIALMPDRTSAGWWHLIAKEADGLLFTKGKISFLKEDGSAGNSPANGTTLFAMGEKGVEALVRAQEKGLGIFLRK